MNVGEFKSFITIEKNRYSEFKVVFKTSTDQQFTVSDASSEVLVTSTWCGTSTEEKFLFMATGLSGAVLSANRLADILDATPDNYEMEFVNNAPGIPSNIGTITIENAWLDDLTTSSVGSGSKVTGQLTLSDTAPGPCPSSSSSS